VYSTEIGGERVEFGTSGFLYRSNKLMFDRKTETLWHQFRAVPAVGPLVGSGMELEVLPMTLTLRSEWVTEHRDTTVLDLETRIYPGESYKPEEQNDSAYFTYRNRKDTMFPVPERSSELSTKEQVLGLAFDDSARAYPMSLFDEQAVINDTLASRNVVVVAAADNSGGRAYDHVFSILESSPADGRGLVLVDDTGTNWQSHENSMVSLDGSGRTLEQVTSGNAYWFGWYAFYPHTDIYTP
jgi:hypothetical protein